ncbi:retron Ec67 family RNA-directed DNA polymerase/endonuclease, partial [Dickeya sp. NCPPB 3274]|uniref:retron Ec67 family RNA-directed DNA polymerase/endonuclease n=1 Tax=Dickeya sp. NCPPB 3274 TaxID=568766 RepID=UPI001267EC89
MPIAPQLTIVKNKTKTMSKNNKLSELKSAKNITDLAKIISVPRQSITYVLYGINRLNLAKYHTFKIPKKDGSERTINAPVKELKDIQKKVSSLLQECFRIVCILEGHRNHLKKINSLSHGFIKGKSIITNATPHKNKRFVLNVDLKDFFGQIHYGRVYGFFKNNKHFQLSDEVAKVLANITCYQQGLPQGAPTSPVISNLIAGILDIKLASLAKKYSCYYTRYADDLTFSTNLKEFPPRIASIENGDVRIGSSLEGIIKKCGFDINHKKNRLQFCNSRQDVTGIVVNKKVNVPYDYRNKARVIWHKLKNGKEIYAINSQPEIKKDINYLIGILSHIHNVRREHRVTTKEEYIIPKKPNKKTFDDIFDADSRMYRDVLFFKNFVKNKKPVIVCEGKTDITYLQCALESQAAKHRSLIIKKELQISFFRPTKTISELFKVTGGTGDIGNLIS